MIAENTTEDAAQANVAESLLHNVEREIEPGPSVKSSHLLKGAAIAGSILLFVRGHKLSAILVGLWPLMSYGWKAAARNPK